MKKKWLPNKEEAQGDPESLWEGGFSHWKNSLAVWTFRQGTQGTPSPKAPDTLRPTNVNADRDPYRYRMRLAHQTWGSDH